MIAGRFLRVRVTVYDRRMAGGWYQHNCWGSPIDPAHVGKHRAKGAPDFGATVPLCRFAHDFYDNRRSDWPISEKQMASAASGYALKFVERGGAAVRVAGGTPAK